MVMRSLVVPHEPLSTSHSNTLAPSPSPVMAENGSVGSVIVAVPLTSVHCPVAGAAGALANMVTGSVIGVQNS